MTDQKQIQKWRACSEILRDSHKWKKEASQETAFCRAHLPKAQCFYLPPDIHIIDGPAGRDHRDFMELYELPYARTVVMTEREFKPHPDDIAAGYPDEPIWMQALTLFVDGSKADIKITLDDGASPSVDPWIVAVELTRHKIASKGFWLPNSPIILITKDTQLAPVPVPTPLGHKFMRDNGWNAVELMKHSGLHPFIDIINLCILLGLRNVRVSEQKPSNVARAMAHDLALYTFKVLEVNGDLWQCPLSEHPGTGIGYRSYLRRGHIRRITEDQRVWVRAHMVHGKREGFVEKDYTFPSNEVMAS